MKHRVWVLVAGLLVLAGCAQPQIRSQSEDDGERDRYTVKTIGDVTAYANMEPILVGGVGLVVGLDGTGGTPQQSDYCKMLEDNLRKRGIDHPRDVLASRDNALVVVSALIPPGARKGDPIDVQVSLPPQSPASSLRGGVLQQCILYNFDYSKNLAPQSTMANSAIQGHPLARAQGRLQVGLGAGEGEATLKQGRIWGGGRTDIDRPLYLILNHDQQRAALAAAVADRINQTFQGAFGGPAGGQVAVAKTKELVIVAVPPQYRLNLPRYLRVVRLIPLQETMARAQDNRAPGATTSPGVTTSISAHGAYRRRLEAEILDPEHAVTAALRLEALGTDSIPALKRGLTSKSVLVRFCSAEALAYLASPACGEELARLVETEPALQAFSLTALASLDEGVCHVKLRDLLACPQAEARYGAFRALRALDEQEPAVQGDLLNESFWLHQVAPGSTPLVHLSTSRRAEIVLFGAEPALVPRFSFLAGEFTLTAAPGDDHCTISCISAYHGQRRRQCSLKLGDVIRTLADLGAEYPDVVELLRQAGDCKCLTCRVTIDALPQVTSVYDLAMSGKKVKDKNSNSTDEKPVDLNGADQEINRARAHFLSTPTLFERGPAPRTLAPSSQGSS